VGQYSSVISPVSCVKPSNIDNLFYQNPSNNTNMASSLEGKEYTIYRGIEGKITALPNKIPALVPRDVLIKITHSGVCYTDLECFKGGYALSLGHEGVGTVVAIGSSVTQFKPGDRAGGGFHKDSCGHCEYCLTGQDIWCYERTIYSQGDFDNGTFGEYYVGKEGYVHKIPEGLKSEHAAPLQCAGATVYNALVDTVTSPVQRVGIMGIGGLGHLAIQFASKMGNEVVVFSTSADKEKEAREFGAKEFVLLNELEKLSAPVNVLIISGSKYPDWDK
jgi:D-arabinose 1-dehydrogenase-like Zn-dependent alcohol dehydrogenase